MNVGRIIQIGSRKPYLQSIALEIFRLCIKHDNELTTQWIPREYNTVSDSISKYIYYNDWSNDFESFNFIQGKFGISTFDRFATHTNREVDFFNLKYFCPGKHGVLTIGKTISIGSVHQYQ